MHAAATGGKNVLKRQMIDRERDSGRVEAPHLVHIHWYLAGPAKGTDENYFTKCATGMKNDNVSL